MFSKTLGAITTLQEKGLTRRHFRQSALQLAGLTGKNERRKTGELRFNGFKGGLIRKSGHLLDRFRSPARRAPFKGGSALTHGSCLHLSHPKRPDFLIIAAREAASIAEAENEGQRSVSEGKIDNSGRETRD
jgi:hypothetical protein